MIRLADWRAKSGAVFFDRGELDQLLSIYSQRVMRGDWRDYAIDQGTGMAVFSVFRHSASRPVFAVAKFAPGQRARGDYLLLADGRRVKEGRSLHDILSDLRRSNLAVVAPSA